MQDESAALDYNLFEKPTSMCRHDCAEEAWATRWSRQHAGAWRCRSGRSRRHSQTSRRDTEELRNMLEKRGSRTSEGSGIFAAIRKCKTKDISPEV